MQYFLDHVGILWDNFQQKINKLITTVYSSVFEDVLYHSGIRGKVKVDTFGEN